MEPVLSVIVPIYKVEPYLRKCLNSICAQTLKEIEIILVDDGSPDSCGEICDEYAKQDSRIRVIHKENGGLSSARNAGMQIAQTDIFGFVDSDDWIDPDMFELLYRNMVNANADISVCGYYQHVGEKISLLGDSSFSIQTPQEAIDSVYNLTGVRKVIWNKLYRKHLFRDICFPEGKIHEDAFVILRLMDAANRIVFNMEHKYHFLCRPGSITQSPFRPASFDILEATLQNYNFLTQKYPTLADNAFQECINAHISMLVRLFQYRNPAYSDVERKCIRFICGKRRVVFSSASSTKSRKLFVLALCICPPLCKLLVRIFNRIQHNQSVPISAK